MQTISVRRSVVYPKAKGRKASEPAKRPINEDKVVTRLAPSSAPTATPRIKPARTPLWKMAWIPLVILLLLFLCLQLATGLGDSLRRDSASMENSRVDTGRVDRQTGRVPATEESFLSTPYSRRSPDVGKALPQKIATRPRQVPTNCVINSGIGTGSAQAALNLTACLEGNPELRRSVR